MANTLVSFREEETKRVQAANICKEIGIDLSTYLRICIARLIQEKGIPFSMKNNEIKNTGIEAMKKASKIAKENGIQDMTLDEINAEINKCRLKR